MSAFSPFWARADPISSWEDWLVFCREEEHQPIDPTTTTLRKNMPLSQFLVSAAHDLPDEVMSLSMLDI